MKPSENTIIALIVVQAAVEVFKLMAKWKHA
jgi:hypothetical protein